MSVSPSDTNPMTAKPHKRALSSSQPYQSSLGEELKNSRNASARSPIRSKPRLSNSSSISSLNYTSMGNSGLSINSAYGINSKRVSTSSSSSVNDNSQQQQQQQQIQPQHLQQQEDETESGFLQTILQQRPHDRRMSNEELIDVMEKEQDAIVVRLMKEISSLKEENKLLKQQLGQSQRNSRSSTTSFNTNYIHDGGASAYKRSSIPTPRNSESQPPARTPRESPSSSVICDVITPGSQMLHLSDKE